MYQMTYLNEAIELFETIVNMALQDRDIVEAAVNFEAKRFRGRRMEDVTRCYYSKCAADGVRIERVERCVD